jgi:hypothetical protein
MPPVIGKGSVNSYMNPVPSTQGGAGFFVASQIDCLISHKNTENEKEKEIYF